MRVKEDPKAKIMPRMKPQSGKGKDAVAFVESSKVHAKLPKKPPKKEKYKK
jgi:hypothetical protein